MQSEWFRAKAVCDTRPGDDGCLGAGNVVRVSTGDDGYFTAERVRLVHPTDMHVDYERVTFLDRDDYGWAS
jgi:hypothetical protein